MKRWPLRTVRAMSMLLVVWMSELLAATPSPSETHAHGSATAPQGVYRIISSSDPMFPADHPKEWFLDFGPAAADGRTAGRLTVSLRENPRVRMRLMVWQYVPSERALVLGNQTHQGSKTAVARGSWIVNRGGGAMVLARGDYRIVLRAIDRRDL